jgi:alpha-ketoglutarate-dependent taurine dioxygenase
VLDETDAVRRGDRRRGARRLTPFGLKVGPGTRPSAAFVAPDALRAWVAEHGIVLLRGFQPLEGAELRELARATGQVRPEDVGRACDDHFCAHGEACAWFDKEVPLHRDAVGGRSARYVVFQCLAAPPLGSGGETFFSDVTRARALGAASKSEARFYDAAACYAHRWREGDVLVADNLALLHGRAPFAPDTLRRVLRFTVA